MKRKVIIPTIALVAILGAVAMGTMPVSAQSPVYTNLVTKIAQRFNLKESDVQAVINEVREEQSSSRNTKWEDRLAKLVTDGKITQSQSDAIKAKRAEVKEQWSQIKNLSASEKKKKMEEISNNLTQWAKDNNIDLSLVGFFGPKQGFGKGFKMGYRAGHS